MMLRETLRQGIHLCVAHAPAASKVRRVGASKVKTRERVKERLAWVVYFLRLASVAMAAGGVTAALVWFNPREKLENFTSKTINEVQVEGSFLLLSKSETTAMIAGLVSGTFIDLDIASLKEKLEQNPWIDVVTVAREWPDKLIVRVAEQQPIARWGEKGFINMRADIIEVEKTTKIQSLPYLNGDDRFAKEVMQQYLRMSKLLQSHDLALSSVSLDATLAWDITLNEDMKVRLGRDRILQKLQYLVNAKNSVLKNDFTKVKAIDMRYPSGFAVAWKETEQTYTAAGG